MIRPLPILLVATVSAAGLPPTPEEMDAFVADKSSCAYERLTDKLLASPR